MIRILCAIGLRDGAELARRALALTASQPEQVDLTLLRVIDSGPRATLRGASGPRHFGPPPHPPAPPPRHSAEMDAADEAAGYTALAETLSAVSAAGVHATTRLEIGKPEQIIVAVAIETQADLIVLTARERAANYPPSGPSSVGHVARFVLDHARCPVLLLRG